MVRGSTFDMGLRVNGGVLYLQFLDRSKSQFYICYSKRNFTHSKTRVLAFTQSNFQNYALCTLPWKDVDDNTGIRHFSHFEEKGYFSEITMDGRKPMKLYKITSL